MITTEQEQSEWIKTLIGKPTPEAVGDILREGFDFYVIHEDGKNYAYRDYSPEGKIVHLKIKKGKVDDALIVYCKGKEQ